MDYLCVADPVTIGNLAPIPSPTRHYLATQCRHIRIPKDTKHPADAFEVLTYLLSEASDALLGIYGVDASPDRRPGRLLRDARRAMLTRGRLAGRQGQCALRRQPNFEAFMPSTTRPLKPLALSHEMGRLQRARYRC